MLRLLVSIFLALFMPVKPAIEAIKANPVEAIPSQYSSQDIIFHGATTSALLTLTFDADMNHDMQAKMASDSTVTWYNDKLIDTLQETQTPATIFLSGLWIETHPEISKTLAGNPLFELGNHSYSHESFAPPCYSLKFVKDQDKSEQITKTQVLLKNLTGKDNLYFRFPGGCYSKKDLVLVKSLGLLPIQWNSHGPDSFNTDTDKIVQNLKLLTKNGAIIVLHLDGGINSPKTAEVVSEYIPWARSEGYEFVKLTDLLR